MYRLLIVDDEAIHRRGLTNMIGLLRPEYFISNAKNGLEALEYVHNNRVDIIITDIQMPIMDGLEFIERVRDSFREIKIIILSVYSNFDYARKAIALSAFEYILKPVEEESVDKVLTRVERELSLELTKKQEQENLMQQLKNVKLNKNVTAADENPTILNLSGIKSNSKNDSVIEMCKSYMAEYYMEELSLEAIARKFHFNPSYFSNYFKNHTNVNFCEYLNRIRMQNAKRMLLGTNNKVYEISKMVGYQDPKYFNRLFKKEFGVTPDEFRRFPRINEYFCSPCREAVNSSVD